MLLFRSTGTVLHSYPSNGVAGARIWSQMKRPLLYSTYTEQNFEADGQTSSTNSTNMEKLSTIMRYVLENQEKNNLKSLRIQSIVANRGKPYVLAENH